MIASRIVNNVNGLKMHILEAGPRGQLVLFLHGFPELARSWKAQLEACAKAGYHCVAPDQRGYGETTGWDAADVSSFGAQTLVKDMVALVLALGYRSCIVVGHDFGTTPAYYAVLSRPDMFRAIALLSIPLGTVPRLPVPRAGEAVNLGYQRARERGLVHYQDALMQPETERRMLKDMRSWLKASYYLNSGESEEARSFSPKEGRLRPMARPIGENPLSDPPASPLKWISDAEIDEVATTFQRTGVRGAINWYRNIPDNVDFLQLFAGGGVRVPLMFLAGEYDFCVGMYQHFYDQYEAKVPGFVSKHLIPDAGHWVQQEKPDEVNRLLLDFFRKVPPSPAKL
eukprot:Sspe_Gene.110065::Locus_90384_Transcript_1_1_Confidence_1.000_Length_1213::g.110065::m.110065